MQPLAGSGWPAASRRQQRDAGAPVTAVEAAGDEPGSFEAVEQQGQRRLVHAERPPERFLGLPRADVEGGKHDPVADPGQSVRPQSATVALDNPGYVDVVLHFCRYRLGFVPDHPPYEEIEQRLTALLPIAIPAVTVGGMADGNFPATDHQPLRPPHSRRSS